MRRAALIGVAAVATFGMGGAVVACGGEGGKPYVALGAAGPTPGVTGTVPPRGKVELVPLDGSAGTPSATAGNTPRPGASDSAQATGAARRDGGVAVGMRAAPSGTHAHSDGGGGSDGSGGAAPSGNGGSGQATGGTGGGTGGSGGSGSPSEPPAPAALRVGAITHTPTTPRWCDRVTVPLRNTGGTPVRTGTLIFATHVIGLLGVDWATVTSEQPLPTPIGAGAAASPTYTVCVDWWRVPMGMHVETRAVTADWR